VSPAEQPQENFQISDHVRLELAKAAWQVRARARILGNTRVGCAVLDEQGRIHTGCNIEHRFRSHDIHAEVAAIGAMVASGGNHLVAVFIAAERERFTPCGACLDWIFELGGGDAQILVQRSQDDDPALYSANELMPLYPR
jgi:cytidine deaminase